MSSSNLSLCLLLSLSVPLLSFAKENGKSSAPGAYASGSLGNGYAYGEGAEGDKSMKGRAFEVRFGRELDPSNFIPEVMFPEDGKIRVDIFHYNEGHADNNHRDGFGSQIVIRKDINQIIKVEAGVGPYFSMNTTKIDGTEYDDPRLGALVTLAVLANMDRFSPGLHLRFAVNHVTMPGAVSTNGFMVGIGKDFDFLSNGHEEAASGSQDPVWFSVMAGDSKTNHGGTKATMGYAVEAKKYSTEGPWAQSVSAIMEGDDGSRVDRQGVAYQGWFVQPVSENWTASAGIGPYAAKNSRESGAEIDGLITIQVERSIGKNWKVFANFNRVASFRKNNDRDMGRIGISRKFGN
jgi:hypothetical protein